MCHVTRGVRVGLAEVAILHKLGNYIFFYRVQERLAFVMLNKTFFYDESQVSDLNDYSLAPSSILYIYRMFIINWYHFFLNTAPQFISLLHFPMIKKDSSSRRGILIVNFSPLPISDKKKAIPL